MLQTKVGINWTRTMDKEDHRCDAINCVHHNGELLALQQRPFSGITEQN